MRARSSLLRTGLLLGSIAIMGVLLTPGWEAKAEPKPRLAVLPFLAGGAEDMEKGAVCPVCKGKLDLNVEEEKDGEIIKGSLYCQNCRVTYPISDGIPNLLPQEEKT